ncbi:MAG TPA: DUF3341 domain-containing protein [Kiritimatiellia bacterium]|nr:DUF3341 domain-containing protein [Kiritimatiellia bacterium]HMO97799.1 DUF3341 domain-containing protein [Kiritimatiellia bacterium]HMP96391.1 DUF3341 domain-containing protein [Kiritimatiellia bacterium]
MKETNNNSIYGVVAEFPDGESLLAAAHRVREAGYTATDAFSPIPVHGLTEALGIKPSKLAGLVLLGGIAGAFGGLGLQYAVSVEFYPHIVSGRPLFSWPSFVPVIFEATVLIAAFAAVFGMFILNRLPEPYHPVFNTPNFQKASTDGFFLSIEARDPKYDASAVRALLEKAGAVAVTEVGKHPDDPE